MTIKWLFRTGPRRCICFKKASGCAAHRAFWSGTGPERPGMRLDCDFIYFGMDATAPLGRGLSRARLFVLLFTAAALPFFAGSQSKQIGSFSYIHNRVLHTPIRHVYYSAVQTMAGCNLGNWTGSVFWIAALTIGLISITTLAEKVIYAFFGYFLLRW